MTTTISKTIEKIKKVLNENNYQESSYDIETEETDSCYWIYIYTPYMMDGRALKKLYNQKINIVNIWADEHHFEHEKTKAECIKTVIGIRK